MTTISIRVDEDVKKRASELFSDLGLDLSAAVNMFLRQAIMRDGIPFDVKREIPNAQTLAALAELEEMKAHPEKYKGYDSVDEMFEDLL